MDENGELQRTDVREKEKENFSMPGRLLGWWSQLVGDEEDPAAHRRQAIKTSEDLFLSLYCMEAEPEGDSQDDCDTDQVEADKRDVLKYILAIVLERKRIIKPLSAARMGVPQRFLHRRLQQEFVVPAVDVNGEVLTTIQEQLEAIL